MGTAACAGAVAQPRHADSSARALVAGAGGTVLFAVLGLLARRRTGGHRLGERPACHDDGARTVHAAPGHNGHHGG